MRQIEKTIQYLIGSGMVHYVFLSCRDVGWICCGILVQLQFHLTVYWKNSSLVS
jgi:hypothetical protein